jgi:hypothetical protein
MVPSAKVTTPIRSETFEVRNPEAIKALFDNRQRSLLAPFFQPTTITEAAHAVDALGTTMLQFVRRMVRFGVLEHVDTARRSGKRVRQYQTVANELFIPIDLAEDVMMTPEKRFHALYADAMREEVVSYHYKVEPVGAVIRALPNGVVTIDGRLGKEPWVPGRSGPLVVFEWSMLGLDELDARAFQAELASLIGRYRYLPLGERPFYFGLHLAPVPDHHALRQFVNMPADNRPRTH